MSHTILDYFVHMYTWCCFDNSCAVCMIYTEDCVLAMFCSMFVKIGVDKESK